MSQLHCRVASALLGPPSAKQKGTHRRTPDKTRKKYGVMRTVHLLAEQQEMNGFKNNKNSKLGRLTLVF